eukprot:CAMPEP_0172748092 /NCGR_PEP_ID=MMETSP1074-20121228/144278_1 /TAXON_ID=2916 /ORGANISM="Ceratium fusus, Strain PA161109" /LENGTH=577 /DNA_ID=CAMNT_0013579761 /DNA_START=65 /DNA_END=1798 /DNA_ORIENTATION=+
MTRDASAQDNSSVGHDPTPDQTSDGAQDKCWPGRCTSKGGCTCYFFGKNGKNCLKDTECKFCHMHKPQRKRWKRTGIRERSGGTRVSALPPQHCMTAADGACRGGDNVTITINGQEGDNELVSRLRNGPVSVQFVGCSGHAQVSTTRVCGINPGCFELRSPPHWFCYGERPCGGETVCVQAVLGRSGSGSSSSNGSGEELRLLGTFKYNGSTMQAGADHLELRRDSDYGDSNSAGEESTDTSSTHLSVDGEPCNSSAVSRSDIAQRVDSTFDGVVSDDSDTRSSSKTSKPAECLHGACSTVGVVNTDGQVILADQPRTDVMGAMKVILPCFQATPWLCAQVLAMHSATCRQMWQSLRGPSKKLKVAAVAIDEFEEDGCKILRNIDLVGLSCLRMVGAMADLVHVLNQIAGMMTLPGWQLIRFSLSQEADDDSHSDDESLEVFFEQAMINCLVGLSQCATLQELEVTAPGFDPHRENLLQFTSALHGINHLVSLKFESPCKQQVKKELEQKGWSYNPLSQALMRESPRAFPPVGLVGLSPQVAAKWAIALQQASSDQDVERFQACVQALLNDATDATR